MCPSEGRSTGCSVHGSFRSIAVLALALAQSGCATQHLLNLGYRRQALEVPSMIHSAPDGALAIRTGATWLDAKGQRLDRHPAKYIVGTPRGVQDYLDLRLHTASGTVVEIRFSNLFWQWTGSGWGVNPEWTQCPHRSMNQDADADCLPDKFTGPGSGKVEGDTVPYEFRGRTYQLHFIPSDIWCGYRPWAVPVHTALIIPALVLDAVSSPFQMIYYAARGQAGQSPWLSLNQPPVYPNRLKY